MAEIVFNELGFAFLYVDIKPRHSQTMRSFPYKIDTGANCTTISGKQLIALGFDADWIKSGKLLEGDERPIVASGYRMDDCYLVVLPEIRIGDYVGYNWSFMTSLSAPFKFLLGTDTMQFFNWFLDYGHGICKFDFIPGKRKLLFNSQEQSIHSIDEIGRR